MRKITIGLFVLLLSNSFVFCKGINTNTATIEELRALPYMTYVAAKAIVDYREAGYEYKKLSDLEKAYEFAELPPVENILEKTTAKTNIKFYAISPSIWKSDTAGNYNNLQCDKMAAKFFDTNGYAIKFYAVSPSVWKSGNTSDYNDLQCGKMAVKFFDVSGYATLVDLPEKGYLLIDCSGPGSEDKLISKIKNNLPKNGSAKQCIDWIIITSPTKYRTSALKKILKTFNVRQVITSLDLEKIENIKTNNVYFKDLIATLSSCEHTTLKRGKKLDLKQMENHVTLTALSPADLVSGDISIDTIEHSAAICLVIEFNKFKFIFPSAIKSSEQKKIARNYSQIIKSNHTVLYGISVGDDNSYFLTDYEEVFRKMINPTFFISPGREVSFITDGYLMYTAEK